MQKNSQERVLYLCYILTKTHSPGARLCQTVYFAASDLGLHCLPRLSEYDIYLLHFDTMSVKTV